MEILREGIPEEGDIVLAEIVGVEQHAAFIKLSEFKEIEGLIHISEVSKTWVKNIRTHFRTNQKVVCKVLDVKNPKYIHASIRRVSDYDKRAKWEEIKRNRRIENIIEIIAKKAKKTPEQIYELLKPFEEKYGEIYFAFEEAKKQGKEFFGKLSIKDEVWTLVDKNISLPVVEITGVLKIESTAPDGVDKIKKILKKIKAETSYLGAPNYRVAVKAMDYKEAEKLLAELIKSAEKQAGKTETVSFVRDKKK
ncbi:MAG: S1 RNA-binding domain-containing protein [Candidatus Altiarchaeota archaeon]|nr:S1 RNA-binding domain-containing protein [Candidatus Altiarchaeota archaeon]